MPQANHRPTQQATPTVSKPVRKNARPVLPLMGRKVAHLVWVGAILSLPLTSKALNVDWPRYGLDVGATRYSTLKQINHQNVANLTEAWSYRTGVKATFQATPIVVDGRMYVSLPYSHVVALDAKTGQPLWRYEHVKRTEKLCCGPASRGVAVEQGMVIVGTVDARLVALNAETGTVLWDVPVVAAQPEIAAKQVMDSSVKKSVRQNWHDPKQVLNTLQKNDAVLSQPVTGTSGVGVAMAPLVVDDLVLVGVNGVGYGVHTTQAVVGQAGAQAGVGFLAAFDRYTGRRIWQFDVTGPGWEGPLSATTADHLPLPRNLANERASLSRYSESWRQGGGSLFSTPTLDRGRGLLFLGTGNPAPVMEGSTRPGDNLYTSSLVALDVHTGKLRWYYQQVPHDLWGLDVSSPPILFDLKTEEGRVPAIAQPSKLGWVYVHDRRDGRLLFRSAAFVPQENLLTPPTVQGVQIAPGIAGGANWSPSAFDPEKGWLFVPGIDFPTVYRVQNGENGMPYVVTEPTAHRAGTLTALDLQKQGVIRWQRQIDEPLIGGVLTTAGHLLFSGMGQQNFAALDSRTGKTLWQIKCAAGVNAPPITYQIDGQQYVAVAVGGNALFGFKQGDEIKVFRLPAGTNSEMEEDERIADDD